MSKIKNMLIAGALALGVTVGGVVVAAPAQAASTTATVVYRQNADGVAYAVTAYLTNGSTEWVRVGQSISGVWKVCPISYNRLHWKAPDGRTGWKAAGVCVVPKVSGGTWKYGIYAAS